MNIAIVCYSTFGGSGVVATELGVALAQKGYQIHFITYGQPVRLSAFHKNIHLHQVYVEEYPLFRYQPYELALSNKMVEIVKEYNIALVERALVGFDLDGLVAVGGERGSRGGQQQGGGKEKGAGGFNFVVWGHKSRP